jgi:hypothetical protein
VMDVVTLTNQQESLITLTTHADSAEQVASPEILALCTKWHG